MPPPIRMLYRKSLKRENVFKLLNQMVFLMDDVKNVILKHSWNRLLLCLFRCIIFVLQTKTLLAMYFTFRIQILFLLLLTKLFMKLNQQKQVLCKIVSVFRSVENVEWHVMSAIYNTIPRTILNMLFWVTSNMYSWMLR